MKIFHLFDKKKDKNYRDNFFHSVFNIINILTKYLKNYKFIIIYFISFNTIELNVS